MIKLAQIVVLLCLAAGLSAAAQVEEGTIQLVHIDGDAIYGETITYALVANIRDSVLGMYDLKVTYNQDIIHYKNITGSAQELGAPMCNSNTEGTLLINGSNTTSISSPTGNIEIARIDFEVITQDLWEVFLRMSLTSVLDIYSNKIPLFPETAYIVLNDPNLYPTLMPTPTMTPTQTMTYTPTPTHTRTPTPTPTFTRTPTNTPTPTATYTPTPTFTATPTPEVPKTKDNFVIALDERFTPTYLFNIPEEDLLYADGPFPRNFILSGINNDMLIVLQNIEPGEFYGRVDGIRWFGERENPLIFKTSTPRIRIVSLVPAGEDAFYIFTTSDVDEAVCVFKISGPFRSVTSVINWGMH